MLYDRGLCGGVFHEVEQVLSERMEPSVKKRRGRLYLLAMHTDEIVLRIKHGEPVAKLAREFSTTRQTVYALAKREGVRPTVIKRNKDARLAAFWLSEMGSAIVLANKCDEVEVTSRNGRNPQIVRCKDGTRVRVYRPRQIHHTNKGSNHFYYSVHVYKDSIALVMLVDGEAFVLEPRTKSYVAYFPVRTESRTSVRAKFRHFQWKSG